MRWTPLAALFALGAPLALSAQIVDHDDVDVVASLPQCALDAVSAQRWLFTHASVGGNLLEGLDDLHAEEPARFPLLTTWVAYDGGALQCDPPPETILPGTVYECGRGNPGWEDKLTIFERSVDLAGWESPAIDLAMDKLCYIDQDADAAPYLAALDALAAAHPDTRFVHATMPLTTGADSDNVLRNAYNQAVRAHCAASGELLYDVADMEAHDPDGVEQTFDSGGVPYQKLFAGYTGDGGHLDTELGHRRVARGWYAVAATLASCQVFTDNFETRDTARWTTVLP